MPVAFDAVGAAGTGSGLSGGVSFSWSHTTGTGSNIAVVVAVSVYKSTSWTPPTAAQISVTYGGTAMSTLGTQQISTARGGVYLYALTGVAASTTSTVQVSTSVNSASTPYFANSVSYTGCSSVDTFTGAAGTSTTASVTESSAVNNMVTAAIMGQDVVSAPTQTQRYINNSGAPRLLIEDAAGAASVSLGATIASSTTWAAAAVNLVSAQNNWTGGATSTTTVASSADGRTTSAGGAVAAATVSATAAGIRGTSSGAGAPITVTASSDGIRGTSSGAAATVFVTATADGAAGGSASTSVTVTPVANGTQIKSGGATTTTTVTAVASGGIAMTGSAATTAAATSTAAGVIGRRSGATTTATVSATAYGVVGEVGSATTTVTVSTSADGRAGGSARTTVKVGGLAEGKVRYADGHLDLTQVDADEAFTRANEFFDANWGAPTELDIRMHDNQGYALGQLGDYISATGTFTRNKPGPGALSLKADDPYGEVGMQCKRTVVPVTMRTKNWKWTGRVVDCYRNTVDGVRTYDVQLIDDLSWMGKVLVYPTWWSPVVFQPIKEAVYIGPSVSVITNMWSEQLLRLNYGLWEIVNNILNPSAYFATAYQLQKDHGNVPIVVVPKDILHDTSKWTCMVARMETIDKVVESTLKDCGLRMKIWLWEPGEPQPAPGHYTLKVPTIVVDVVDETNVQGITGTALDGLIGEAVEFADTALGGVISALLGADTSDLNDTDGTNPYQGFLADWLGLDSIPPWVVYEDGPYSSVTESHVGAHHPLAWQVVGGGHSPSWVNKLIDVLLEALLSAILAFAGVSGISDALLDGIFDDIILAFQLVQDVRRRQALGKFGWPEALTQTGGTAWTLNEFVALEAALWDTRGSYTFQFITKDGYPYTFGKDLDIGTPTSYVELGTIYTDYLDQAVFTDDRSNFIDLKLTIGDLNPQESPWAKFSRHLESAENAIKAFTLQSG